MKVIDLLNIWVEDRDKLPEKIKMEDKINELVRAVNKINKEREEK